MQQGELLPGQVERQLERERCEVEVALEMVRAGVATQVSLTNLRFARLLIRQLRGAARADGLVLAARHVLPRTSVDVVVSLREA